MQRAGAGSRPAAARWTTWRVPKNAVPRRAMLRAGIDDHGGSGMTDTTAPAAERPLLDRYFRLSENGTDVRTELVAGVTTFLTMVYIVFVNPQILGNAGMDKGAVFVATCIAAAV